MRGSSLSIALLVPACGTPGVDTTNLAGSYVRQDAVVPGLVTRLHVTPTGLTVTTPTLGARTSASVDVDGKPLVGGAVKTELGLEAHGAALFETVRCDRNHACSFVTRSKCEGTLTGDGKGNVVLIATGDCGAWSGKWLAEKDETARAGACPPATPCPPCGSSPPAPPPPPPPTASASASASASGAPRAPSATTCMMDCSRAQTTCAEDCKVNDVRCLQRCSGITMECIQRCHP